MTVSTIREEKHYNPRLQVSGKQSYIDLMNGLELDDPRLMDIAVPANRACACWQRGEQLCDPPQDKDGTPSDHAEIRV